MIRFCYYFVSCFSIFGLWNWTFAEDQLSKFARQGERLFSEQLYQDALSFYSQAYSVAPDDETKIELANRLAVCHLKSGNPAEAFSSLFPLVKLQNAHQHYLLSFALRQMGKRKAALEMLDSFPKGEKMMALEKGYHLFHLGDTERAHHVLTTIDLDKQDPIPYALAQLFLAKIDILKSRYPTGRQTLDDLAPILPLDHPLHLERIYLTGWICLATEQYAEAQRYFEKLLPKATHGVNVSWPIQVFRGLILSLLNQALSKDISKDQVVSLLSQAEEVISLLIARSPSDATYLLMGDFTLIKAKTLRDPNAYAQAQKFLEKASQFSSKEKLWEVQLKIAAAAPNYKERRRLFESLCENSHSVPDFCSKAWFQQATNDFNEGLQSLHLGLETENHFELAGQAFHKAAILTSEQEFKAVSSKYEALAYAYQGKTKEAWNILLSFGDSMQEFEYLIGWIALQSKEKDHLQQARGFLQTGQKGDSPLLAEKCLKMEGLICLQLMDWLGADALFNRFLIEYPSSSSLGEIWFWKAFVAEKRGLSSLKREYLTQAYTSDPSSSFAPFAYFYAYSYREYMLGSRKTIKHLQAMPLHFPSHPLLITAHYLIGLNHKKDHLSEEGHVVRHKDWTAAIDAFQLAETTFDHMYKNHLIAPKELPYYLNIRLQAQLGRAMANFAIAKSSTGGKRQIYLEYAESVFAEIIHDFAQPNPLLKEIILTESNPYPKTWAEAHLQLARIYEERGFHNKAEMTLNQSLEHYRKANIRQTQGLMAVWSDKGKLAQRQNKNREALDAFIEAEKAAGDYSTLSPNEKLDLWIQQSLCYSSLQQFDEAMTLLSRVINDDVISPLRVKAMYLRAEIYEQQGRPELALKQLEATARKGGEWAKKAQEKLEQKYGYQ